jgi:hypothetical protein
MRCTRTAFLSRMLRPATMQASWSGCGQQLRVTGRLRSGRHLRPWTASVKRWMVCELWLERQHRELSQFYTMIGASCAAVPHTTPKAPLAATNDGAGTGQRFMEMEQVVYDDLRMLIRDTALLRDYTYCCMTILQARHALDSLIV